MLVEPVLEMMLLFDAQPALRSGLPQTLFVSLVMHQVQVGLLLYCVHDERQLRINNEHTGCVELGLEVGAMKMQERMKVGLLLVR
jgi:hypothetical protein